MKKTLAVLFVLTIGFVWISADEKPSAVKVGEKRPEWSGKGGESFDDRPLLKKLFSRLSQEEIARLKELHDSDPEAFRKELINRFRERETEMEMKNSRSAELARKYHETKDETERAKLKEEIKKAVIEEFDAKMKRNRERLERAEKQLQEFKKNIDEREKNREAIIENRINDLLKDPALKW